MNALEVITNGPVIPVIVLDDAAAAVPLARALVAGGVRVLEVTLRTPAALASVRAIAANVPDAIVGVGTITAPDEFAQAREAGARFGVSPGLTPALAAAAKSSGMPWLPGVMTPSEVMVARAAGFSALKFFPAQPAGGVAMLKALAGPFPDVMFCPTGSITAITAPEYLALDNVACVGGSWLCAPEAVRAGAWTRITELAHAASQLHAGK
jgi:2-dehydro-3-deoxyphosphogluconate aldolase/(4S)-4-hydroxy-2-oxoglutarate aldolase